MPGPLIKTSCRKDWKRISAVVYPLNDLIGQGNELNFAYVPFRNKNKEEEAKPRTAFLFRQEKTVKTCMHTLFSDIIKRLVTLILFHLSDTFSLLFISFYCSNLFFALIFPASLWDDHPQKNPASKVLESRLDPSFRQVRFPQEVAKAAVAVRGPLRKHVSGGGFFCFCFLFCFCFFFACEDFGECSTIHSPPALFFFFFDWRLA